MITQIEKQLERIAMANEAIAKAHKRNADICYGFTVNPNESNPASAVTYIEDAVGMTPAKMDTANGIFNYGSWGDAFFMPRPCMLRSDGTVAYYLNPANYAQKDDGSPSDVANTAFDGNAMMEWGRDGRKIWYKVVPNSSNNKGGTVYIANYQKDSGFKCYSFIGKNNTINEHFYTPIYNGSNVSSKLRSLSGQSPITKLSGTTEVSYAKANGEGWNIECFADRTLINFLLILMGKSLDTQGVFGNGFVSGGSETVFKTTGYLNNKGLFYGDSSSIKVFGMENYWGQCWRRTNGYINASGTIKIKMTAGTADGTTVSDYNTDGSGYLSVGTAPTASGSYISRQTFTEYGIVPTEVSGSASTYYCDGMWTNNNQTNFALVGGSSNGGTFCGAFAVTLHDAVGFVDWNVGACLSYRHS